MSNLSGNVANKHALNGNLIARGVDGKSAYQYAQDGGYTGTEEEFSVELAQTINKLHECTFVTDITDQVVEQVFDFSTVETGLYWSDTPITIKDVSATGLFSVLKLTNTMVNVHAINDGYLAVIDEGTVVTLTRSLSDTDTFDNLTTTDKTILGAINEVNEKSSVQPNWNQSDETARDFIKGRTHYTDEKIYSSLENKTMQKEDGTRPSIKLLQIGYLENKKVYFHENAIFKFVINDVEYIADCSDLVTAYPSTQYLLYGKIKMILSLNRKSSTRDATFSLEGDSWVGEITASVYYEVQSVKPLDEKYLPDTIVRTSDLPTIDSEMSDESENPVQNKVIKEYIDSHILEDEEVLRMLAEANLINITTDENGDIFTDLDGNIIVF